MEQKENVTFDDLRWYFGTGKAIHVSGTGRDKKFIYRSGVITRLGDLELSQWKAMMYDCIDRAGEQDLFMVLSAWVSENCPWLHTRGQREEYALELHSCRIFENPEWVDYEAFHGLLCQETAEQIEDRENTDYKETASGRQ